VGAWLGHRQRRSLGVHYLNTMTFVVKQRTFHITTHFLCCEACLSPSSLTSSNDFLDSSSATCVAAVMPRLLEVADLSSQVKVKLRREV